jgi:hypothetical protein
MPCPRYVESNIQLVFSVSVFIFFYFGLLHIAFKCLWFTSVHYIYINIDACISSGICKLLFVVSSSV